jgi:hypothetical protein
VTARVGKDLDLYWFDSLSLDQRKQIAKHHRIPLKYYEELSHCDQKLVDESIMLGISREKMLFDCMAMLVCQLPDAEFEAIIMHGPYSDLFH